VTAPALLAALAVAALAPAVPPATADPPGSAAPPPEPAQAVRQVFAGKRFLFCHEPSYPLTAGEKRWCDLGAGNNTQACPALRDACNNDALAKQLELREPFSIHLPEVGLPVRLLLWILLGLGVGMLIFALVRHFLDRKAKEDVVATRVPDAGPDDAAAALARQVETDVQRLLERARARAAAGDFREAMGDAYAALLRRLEGAGVVRIEPHQTNGDYLRSVRGERPAIAGRMEEVVDAVEGAQFGDKDVTARGFDGVWTRVLTILAQRIGLLLLAGGLLLLTSTCGLPRDDWEHSPSGRAGVIAYLGKRGFKVHERLLSVAKINESTVDELVLLPGARLGKEEWSALARWMATGEHALVIAGGRHHLPDWVGMRIVERPATASEPVVPSDAAAKRWGPLQVRVPEGNYVECGAEDRPLLRRKHGPYAAQRRSDEEGEFENRVLVLADDFLFRNASLLLADNAVALDHLLRDGGTSIELAGDLTGLVSTNPVQSVQRGRLGPAMLQLLAFVILLFAHKGARFGRPVHAERIERRAFAEHVRALGLHYARARAERQALAHVGQYAIERLRERFGRGASRSLSGLAEAVATRTGRPVGEVMRLLLEARDASKGVPADKGARDLETAAEITRLLAQTGGSGGHT